MKVITILSYLQLHYNQSTNLVHYFAISKLQITYYTIYGRRIILQIKIKCCIPSQFCCSLLLCAAASFIAQKGLLDRDSYLAVIV